MIDGWEGVTLDSIGGFCGGMTVVSLDAGFIYFFRNR